MNERVFDCIILGGGPAGLQAGVYMGRYRRPTLILNHKKPMTQWHRPTAHNVLGFPAGIHRNQLLEWGVAHVSKYECVGIQRATVCEVDQTDHGYVLMDTEGGVYRSRGLILAMGVEHVLPEIPEILAFAGRSMWHCPECDGYKCMEKDIVVIGSDRGTAEMAMSVLTWTETVKIATMGAELAMDEECFGKLEAEGVEIIREPIVRILGDRAEGVLEGFEFASGRLVKADGAFINSEPTPPHPLLKKLPLELHKGKWVVVNHRMRTNLPRCYAAGDIIANAQTQLAVAMGTGATAAIGLHKELLPVSRCLSGHEW